MDKEIEIFDNWFEDKSDFTKANILNAIKEAIIEAKIDELRLAIYSIGIKLRDAPEMHDNEKYAYGCVVGAHNIRIEELEQLKTKQ